MLTEQRYEMILQLLEEKKSITVTEAKELLDASESTIRRDITALHKAGKLVKVFGGAVAVEHAVTVYEPTVAQKEEMHKEEKMRIARAAAQLIDDHDFVYLDAGTTTGCMLEHLAETKATFVTNAVAHAQNLAAKGVKVLLVGGELKSSTEAVVGSQAMMNIRDYHFTKGFFGANGITKKEGYTTPDANEALIKRAAMEQCRKKYMLADSSKFGGVGSVTFAAFLSAEILTEAVPKEYKECRNIKAVE